MYSNKSLSSHILSLSLFCWQIETGASKARIRKKSHSQGWLNSSFIFFIRFLLALIKWSNDFLMVFVNRSSLAGRIAALAHIKKALIHSKQKKKSGDSLTNMKTFAGALQAWHNPTAKYRLDKMNWWYVVGTFEKLPVCCPRSFESENFYPTPNTTGIAVAWKVQSMLKVSRAALGR